MFKGRISNCYDSHAHLLATGEVAARLNLKNLPNPESVSSLIVEPHNKISEWIIGFGWDETQWPEKPHRKFLDEAFPTAPVVFSRIDGHVFWVNTEVLKRIGWLNDDLSLKINLPKFIGGHVEVDDDGIPTGVLIDTAKHPVKEILPKPSETEVQSYLLSGLKQFHQAGFTHIRDMTCSEVQWNEILKLEASGLLSLGIEQTFSAENPNDFDAAVMLAKRAMKAPLKRVRPHALKVYYDGALGSEGALLSQPYPDGKNYGLRLMTKNELKGFMRMAWELPLDIAVHTIGDQAAHETAEAAVELWDAGYEGRLHMEHAQVMRSETIKLLKGRDVICHIQPCHWLTDRRWLKEKLGPLYADAFPWKRLQDNNIPFFFGSDSPISGPSVLDNLVAIEESKAEGIPPLSGEPAVYHSHPDHAWIPNSFTIFEDDKVKEVVFQGKVVYS